ncbi:MAG: hypothetical protein LBS63_01930 [Prevotellaceae bacterium]|jgi:MraZ protein|nr:hypothetical protein [Prevotellaceae bacterium]
MALFIGEYVCKVDDKGRVPFPAPFRAAAVTGDGQIHMVAKKDLFTKSLTLMTEAEYEKEVSLIEQSLDPYDDEQQALSDELFRDMAPLEVDPAGRVLLPKRLIAKAGISKEVVFVGKNSRVKLWDKATYEGSSMPEPEVAALAKKYLRKKQADARQEQAS